jgi:antitoxin CptB
VTAFADPAETAGQAQDREVLRLRWQCRRGMLELDLLLNRFLDLGFGNLDPMQRATFNRLLAYQDQILYDWLIGHAVPADADVRDLVAGIRAAMLA